MSSTKTEKKGEKKEEEGTTTEFAQNKKKKNENNSKRDDDNGDDDIYIDSLIQSTLFRFTEGLPKRELDLMVKESEECEALLEQDIRILEEALRREEEEDSKQDTNNVQAADTSLNIIMESPLTPLDRYWTASALLGRLRSEMALPPSAILLAPPTAAAVNNNTKGSKKEKLTAVQEEQNLLPLHGGGGSTAAAASAASDDLLAAAYSQKNIPTATLLTVFRKIFSNRAATVFKRPVRSEEAPGYNERIVFPMDLSLIRKRIVAGNITTFSELHAAVGLISHNCVKYNGRESDYGRVARDFEAMADGIILQAVKQEAAGPPPAASAAAAAQPTAATHPAAKAGSATAATAKPPPATKTAAAGTVSVAPASKT